MKYKFTIIKYEKNENYEAEMAKWKEDRNGYGRMTKFNEPDLNEPRMEVAERSLEVFLTEEEYQKVKSEVIKVFN